MKINCESCGSTIDIEKDTVCPGCKSPYDKNKEYLEYKEQKKREELLSFRQKETMTNLTEKISNKFDEHAKHSKTAVVVFIVVALVIAVISFNVFKQFNNQRIDMINEIDFSGLENKTKDLFKKKEYTEVPVSLSPQNVDGLEFNVDKYLIAESNKDGFNEIIFHITAHNNSTVSKIVTKATCTVDGVIQRTTITFDYDDFPQAGFIDAKLSSEGYKAFLVSKDATSVDLTLNEKATFHINLK